MLVFFDRLLDELNSSVVVLAVLLIISFYMVFKMGKWGEVFSNHKERIGNIESIRDLVLELNTKVSLIYQNLNPNALTMAQSPVGLSDAGLEVANEIQAETIFKNYSSELGRIVEKTSCTNPYDIQQRSFSVANKDLPVLLTEPDLEKIKTAAFHRGLLVEDIMPIFGVLLRNMVLEQKNIPISEVDVPPENEKLIDN